MIKPISSTSDDRHPNTSRQQWELQRELAQASVDEEQIATINGELQEIASAADGSPL
jgi:hypothetical protein